MYIFEFGKQLQFWEGYNSHRCFPIFFLEQSTGLQLPKCPCGFELRHAVHLVLTWCKYFLAWQTDSHQITNTSRYIKRLMKNQCKQHENVVILPNATLHGCCHLLKFVLCNEMCGHKI